MIYSRVAKETESLFFDGYQFARSVAAELGVTPESIFLDDLHIKPTIANVIGTKIMNSLTNQRSIPSVKKAIPDFYNINLDRIEGAKVITRKTSLLSRSFASLSAGEELKIPLPDGCELVGLSINAAKTFGSVKISGNSTIIKPLTSPFYNAGKEMRMLVAPITTRGVSSKDQIIRISLAEPEDTPTEIGRYGGTAGKYKGTPYLEIGSVVVRKVY